MSPQLAEAKTGLTPFEHEGLALLASARTHLRSPQTYMMETEECRWVSQFMNEVLDRRYGPIEMEVAS